MFGFLTIGLLLVCAQDDPGQVAQAAPEPTAEQVVLRVERWLTLDPVDRSGRIPVAADQVFLRHLVDPAAAPPVDRQEVVGTVATHSWKSVAPGADGKVPVVRGGWAYGVIDTEENGVWLARLSGAIRLHVNGEAFVGDVYRYGFGGVPVFLKKGRNHLYVAGARGSFQLDFVQVEEGLMLADWDALVPEVLSWEGISMEELGESEVASSWGAVVALNASTAAVSELPVTSSSGPHTGRIGSSVSGGMIPLGIRRVRFATGQSTLASARQGWESTCLVELGRHSLSGAPEGREVLSWRTPVRSHQPLETHRRTFLSEIDGSVQSYGYVPPSDGDGSGEGLVLSLHGASVECMNQARAYAAKEAYTIVTPTNRRPYGFDWQDWGRQDAYEVLDHALAASGASPDRVHLTGHSMGGHGTWHLGVNDPDRWASIAPSAGWASFDSYGGRPEGELDAIWRGADATSETMDMLSNLRGVPVSVLHGDADDNVPASEARTLVKALSEMSIRHQAHFEPGAGHWWGNRCVDWPGFFAMFDAVQRRPSSRVLSFDWHSAGPAVDSDYAWFEALQRIDSGAPFWVRAQRRKVEDYVRLEISTKNLRSFRLNPDFEPGVREVAIDGHLEWTDLGEGALPSGVIFRRYDWEGSPRQQGADRLGGALDALGGHQERDYWVRLEETEVPAGQKSPERDGPFKRAFDRRFVMVYGTGGDDARDAALLARARHDAQQWWYRANGDCPVISDLEFLADRAADNPQFGPDRNVILYGNAESNTAWDTLISADCPLQVQDGVVRLGTESWEGEDRLSLAVYPQKGSDAGLVGIIAETGLKGVRLGDAMKYFVSGTGYPDYLIISSAVLAEGDGAVDAAGFFDYAWQLPK